MIDKRKYNIEDIQPLSLALIVEFNKVLVYLLGSLVLKFIVLCKIYFKNFKI